MEEWLAPRFGEQGVQVMAARKNLREKIGDYFLDVSKLVFAGVVLSTVLSFDNFPKLAILLAGLVATITTALLGLFIEKEE